MTKPSTGRSNAIIGDRYYIANITIFSGHNISDSILHYYKKSTWIHGFLTDWVQRTIVDDNISKPISFSTSTGTPQGCCLSPLLFPIYTNQTTSSLSNITVIKYADDTWIIHCIGNQSELHSYFNEINKSSEQCNALNLLLNLSKT